MVLKWIINPDLHLSRFVNTSLNPADVGTRVESVKWSGSHSLWLNGPDFLLQKSQEPQPFVSTVTMHRAGVGGDPSLSIGSRGLD